MKIIKTVSALFAITTLIAGQMTSKADDSLFHKISFDPTKVSRDQAIAVVTAVFDARGYKPKVGGMTEVKVGEGGKTSAKPAEGFKIVDMEFQPPVEGSKSEKWKFLAQVNDSDITVMVYIKVPPRQGLFGRTIDSVVTAWQPPDLKPVMEEIRKRLTSIK